MLKISGSTNCKIRYGEDGVGIDGSSKVGRDGRGSRIDDDEVDDDEVEDDEIKKKVQKCKNLSKSKKAVGSDFFIFGARLAFTELKQVFVKAPILYHFDPECHIRIETDASGYAIGKIFSQLTLDNLGQWHLVTFFSQKMIPAKTKHETHDGEFLAIVEAFKT